VKVFGAVNEWEKPVDEETLRPKCTSSLAVILVSGCGSGLALICEEEPQIHTGPYEPQVCHRLLGFWNPWAKDSLFCASLFVK
jgi:hypothetical protein